MTTPFTSTRVKLLRRRSRPRATRALLALANTFYHWGGIIVPPGYTDPVQFRSGNPYGTSHAAGDGPPGELALQAARYQARRVVVDTATHLKAGRTA